MNINTVKSCPVKQANVAVLRQSCPCHHPESCRF